MTRANCSGVASYTRTTFSGGEEISGKESSPSVVMTPAFSAGIDSSVTPFSSGAANTSAAGVRAKLAVNAAVQAKARYVFFSKD